MQCVEAPESVEATVSTRRARARKETDNSGTKMFEGGEPRAIWRPNRLRHKEYDKKDT